MSATGHNFTKDASVRITVIGGTEINLTAHGNSVDIDYNADDLEATAYGDSAHTFLQGLTNYSFNYSGWWAGSHASDVTNSVAACVFNLVQKSSASQAMFWISPAGSTAGSLGYAACVNVQAFPMSFPADNIATMAITCTPRSGSLSACDAMVFGP
jgi:hypothetical protein